MSHPSSPQFHQPGLVLPTRLYDRLDSIYLHTTINETDTTAMPFDSPDDQMRRRAGTPFLLGPEGSESPSPNAETEDPPTDPIDDTLMTDIGNTAPTSTAESTRRRVSTEATSTSTEQISSEKMTSTVITTSSTLTFSDTSSATTSVSASTMPISALDGADPPAVQLKSLAYLVPVFLLILITLGAIIYRKYRIHQRKRLDRESSTTFRTPSPKKTKGQGWKEIQDLDEDDKEGIWDDGFSKEEQEDYDRQWRDVYVKESKSRPGLLDVSAAGGWSRSSAWKSARSVNDQAEKEDRGQKTVKLVTRSEPTYESLLPGETPSKLKSGPSFTPKPVSTPNEGRFGSLKAFKDSISSITLHPIVRQLERTRSPNKRRTMHPAPPPPKEPAWIRPRAASPVNVLSPPSQPHFFFQPTPPQSMVMHRAQVSESIYSVDETETESMLSSFNQRRVEFADSPIAPSLSTLPETLTRNPSRSRPTVDLDRTPTRASMATITSSTTPSGSSPAGMRRSSAVKDLARSPSKRKHKDGLLSPNAHIPLTPSVRKQKKLLKDDKARQRVESILQASWSDRALSSPSASMDSLTCPPDQRRIGQVPGWASPGMEQVGGIQARLAMLRSMEK